VCHSTHREQPTEGQRLPLLAGSLTSPCLAARVQMAAVMMVDSFHKCAPDQLTQKAQQFHLFLSAGSCLGACLVGGKLEDCATDCRREGHGRSKGQGPRAWSERRSRDINTVVLSSLLFLLFFPPADRPPTHNTFRQDRQTDPKDDQAPHAQADQIHVVLFLSSLSFSFSFFFSLSLSLSLHLAQLNEPTRAKQPLIHHSIYWINSLRVAVIFASLTLESAPPLVLSLGWPSIAS